jgi:hypothetical protein
MNVTNFRYFENLKMAKNFTDEHQQEVTTTHILTA